MHYHLNTLKLRNRELVKRKAAIKAGIKENRSVPFYILTLTLY